MGRELIRAIGGRRDAELVAALVRAGSRLDDEPLSEVFGESAPALDFSVALDTGVAVDVLIDFSHAEAFDAALALALERRIGLVSGTTGLDERQRAALDAASLRIPVLWASNFSTGIAVLKRLAMQATALLGDGFEIEIIEAHHRNKVDAPSGTALTLGRAIAAQRGRTLDQVARFERQGMTGPRAADEIGFSVVRAADIIGEHTVLFATAGERLELIHRASDRSIFAAGAVRAAVWLARQAPGMYHTADTLD